MYIIPKQKRIANHKCIRYVLMGHWMIAGAKPREKYPANYLSKSVAYVKHEKVTPTGRVPGYLRILIILLSVQGYSYSLFG